MQFHDGKRPLMRALIRRQNSEFYLQPSGRWGVDREKARSFISLIVAYYWAKEQRLLDREVVLAFDSPRYEIRVLRLGACD
jgi:hypothetical protein